MGEALLFGILGSSALVLGGALGAKWAAPTRVSGVLLAFASGTLFAALSFELFPEAVHLAGLAPAAAGLLLGGTTFVVANTWVDSRVARSAGEPHEVTAPAGASEELSGAGAQQTEKVHDAASANVGPGVAFGLVAAVTLDGVPENLAMGVSLLGGETAGEGGRGIALLVAIFTSNFPEALVGAVAMRASGRSAGFAIGVWSAAAFLLTAAVVVGYALFSKAGDTTLAFALAFAGGAVLASLADTLMPEAFERGRPFNSFATAAGFFVAFVLATI